MNGVSLLQIVREQFYSEAPPSIARPGVARIQVFWLALGLIVAVAYALADVSGDPGASILAANAVFTALSITMAMFFWPRAINIKSDSEFAARDERWHVYRLTTQLFWTVLVGIAATGLAVVQLVIPDRIEFWFGTVELAVTSTVVQSISVGLTVYQVLLLGQSVFRLYAATYWMPRA
ncbi:hypothetical protein QE418_000141 [Microbacterium testaceum]|uniref:hypothetical protein n=1 Tax=Microbacterium TaxID=33882 RepID=UPI00278469CE|nr:MULTISPECIES: hypothetical protein [Microbacterium]MDQ1110693.1 hypothetical protein [Microbacterium testaceum]MDR6098760.1 hypothetical protein [Microbacterium sp. SORGH_AS_0454]